MIQLTKTQHRAMTAYLEDRAKAEAGIQELLREVGVQDGQTFDYNPILGQLTIQEIPLLEEIVEASGGQIVGDLEPA